MEGLDVLQCLVKRYFDEGFLQEIGPYYLADGIDYKENDSLTENPYSWHRASNLLFIESPAGVGYSYNLDVTFQFNDSIVALDTFNAVLDFFSNNKFSEYKNNSFWVAGESYAGKYIPDLTVLLDNYNLRTPNNSVALRGFLIGNGVMDFTDGSLYESQVEYMIKHDFVDPDLVMYWKMSCKIDPLSAGCNYFYKRYEDNIL
jgi:serine carboxypeptidase-like clade 2